MLLARLAPEDPAADHAAQLPKTARRPHPSASYDQALYHQPPTVFTDNKSFASNHSFRN